jgi:hypothetical protein
MELNLSRSDYSEIHVQLSSGIQGQVSDMAEYWTLGAKANPTAACISPGIIENVPPA